MEMMIPKEIPAGLPIAVAMPAPPSATNAGASDTRRAEQRTGVFSEKLSAALDKSVPSEPVEPKAIENNKSDGNEKGFSDTVPPGLSIGLAWGLTWGLPNNEIPVAMKAASMQETEAVSADGPAQTAQMPVPAFMINQESASQTSLLTAASTAPMVPAENLDSAEVVPPYATGSERSQGNKPEMAVLMPVKQETPAQFEVKMKSDKNSPNQQVVANVQQLRQKPANPIDSNILRQDAVSVQGSVISTVPQTPTLPSAASKVEVKPSEIRQEPILVEEAPELLAAPVNASELSKKSLHQAESDAFLNTADKTDTTVLASIPFDHVLNSVDQTPRPGEAALQSRQDLHEVARQVMDGMTASTDRLKSSQVIITLKPEHLGEVTVRINVDGDRVTAAFHAASAEVRAILESSLPQLRQEMSQQGWNFDSNGVFGGMRDFLANQQQQQSQAQEQQLLQAAQRAHRDEYDGIVAFTNGGRLQVMSATAVDYRI